MYVAGQKGIHMNNYEQDNLVPQNTWSGYDTPENAGHSVQHTGESSHGAQSANSNSCTTNFDSGDTMNVQNHATQGYSTQGSTPNGLGRSPMPEDKRQKSKFWSGFLTGFVICLGVISVMVLVFFNVYIRYGGDRIAILSGKESTVTTDTPTSGDNDKQLDTEKISAKLTLLQKLIKQYYLFDEDMTNVEEYIYKGMLAGLDDPYSTYYTAEEYESFVADMNGPEEYAGIGAGVTKDTTTGLVNVTKVYKGTPAEEAGLRDGDVIYMVDEIDVTDMDLDLLVNEHVRGEAGTDVTLTIQRAGESELMEITITRRAVTLKTVEHEMLEGNIGYIAVTSFDVVTVDEFKAAVDELETAGMEKLVIDLRGNVGGLVDSAVEMLDYMLPDGLLVYTADRYGQGTKYNGSDGHEVDVPTAILINENSASASELFAGAYKDYDKATIVGNTSFGKGIVQVTVPLGDGSAIKITTEHYYTPSGFDLHGKGIEPDIEVDLDVGVITGSEQDNQLAAAIEALGE